MEKLIKAQLLGDQALIDDILLKCHDLLELSELEIKEEFQGFVEDNCLLWNDDEPLKLELTFEDQSVTYVKPSDVLPMFDPDDCINCSQEAEDEGLEYHGNFSPENFSWICDECRRSQ